MKHIFTLFFAFALIMGVVFPPNSISATAPIKSNNGSIDEGEHETLEQVLEQLLRKYDKSKLQEFSCNDLTDQDFEKVGDAVMESMHPGEAHGSMDNMMGGEGSESLRQMHIRMGKRYFGCETDGFVGGMEMMGRGGMGMMGQGLVSAGWPAVGGFAGLYSIATTITWISFIALLISGARWFWKRAGK